MFCYSCPNWLIQHPYFHQKEAGWEAQPSRRADFSTLSQVLVKDDRGEKEALWGIESRGMENNGLGRYSQKAEHIPSPEYQIPHGICSVGFWICYLQWLLCVSFFFFCFFGAESVLVLPFPTVFWEREGQTLLCTTQGSRLCTVIGWKLWLSPWRGAECTLHWERRRKQIFSVQQGRTWKVVWLMTNLWFPIRQEDCTSQLYQIHVWS